MNYYYISLNQFAEFSSAAISSKKRITGQQLNPNNFLLPWYRKARSAMKQYLKDLNNEAPVIEAVSLLANKIPDNRMQEIDRRVSIESLNQLKSFAFPEFLRDVEFEMIRPRTKNIRFDDVTIIVAPDVILKGYYNGKFIYGAIKIHICRSKTLDDRQSRRVSSLLSKYLNNEINKKEGIVLPEICLCLDIFGGRITSALSGSGKEDSEIKNICEELKLTWSS